MLSRYKTPTNTAFLKFVMLVITLLGYRLLCYSTAAVGANHSNASEGVPGVLPRQIHARQDRARYSVANTPHNIRVFLKLVKFDLEWCVTWVILSHASDCVYVDLCVWFWVVCDQVILSDVWPGLYWAMRLTVYVEYVCDLELCVTWVTSGSTWLHIASWYLQVPLWALLGRRVSGSLARRWHSRHSILPESLPWVSLPNWLGTRQPTIKQ